MNIYFAYLSGILYVILTVISSLFIEHNLPQMGDSVTTLFISMIIAAVFFHLVGFKRIKQNYVNIINHKIEYLLFSLSIFLVWIFFMLAINNSNSFIANVNVWVLLATISFGFLFKNDKWFYGTMLILGVGIIIACLLLNLSLYKGALFALADSICSYTYRKVSSSFARNTKSNAIDILMTRFWLGIIILSFFCNYAQLVDIMWHHALGIIIFAFISLIIPVYLNQYTINVLGAENSALIAALIFPLIWGGEKICANFGNANVTTETNSNLFIAVAASILIILPNLKKMFGCSRNINATKC